ncbi:MAG: hypothetical protein IOD12_07450, partial [Silvanigrellales bacterium]|nr:hypothetical protein [Silvanigrellales bacterium]
MVQPSREVSSCRADGQVDCVANDSFRAAEFAKVVPGHVKGGVSIAGVMGTLSADGPADCVNDGEIACVSTAAFPAVKLSLLTPSVLKKDVTVAGVVGQFPSADHRLSGADGTADLTSLAATTAAGTYEFFDSTGTRYTGVISDAGSLAVGTSNQTFNTSLYRQFTVPGDADLVPSNIASGVNVLGVAGNVVLPGAGDVKLNVQFGVNGTGLTGSYAGTSVADCTGDGQSDCRIPATGNLRSADTTHFNPESSTTPNASPDPAPVGHFFASEWRVPGPELSENGLLSS